MYICLTISLQNPQTAALQSTNNSSPPPASQQQQKQAFIDLDVNIDQTQIGMLIENSGKAALDLSKIRLAYTSPEKLHANNPSSNQVVSDIDSDRWGWAGLSPPFKKTNMSFYFNNIIF